MIVQILIEFSIKSLSAQRNNPENPCCCGVFGILAIIPTQQAILDTLHFCLDFVIVYALYDLYYPVSMDYTDLLLSNRYHH